MEYESSRRTPHLLPPKYPAPFLSRQTLHRPVSQATEIFDTDFESEVEDDFEFDESPRASLATDSVTTLSSYRDVRTPDSHMAAEHININKDEMAVRGPNGPHLFRASMDSTDLTSTMEVGLVLAKTPTTGNFPHDVMQLDPPPAANVRCPGTNRKFQHRKANSLNNVPNFDEETVQAWSPEDVAMWMRSQSFDEGLVENFINNDISGSILLELRNEDLKELDIQSFGKRRHLMNSIMSLRNSVRLSSGNYRTSSGSGEGEDSLTSEDEISSSSISSSSRQQSAHNSRSQSHSGLDELKPSDSASIVAIEQLIPKQHNCSKGENCRKWQKQQLMFTRLTHDLPKDSVKNGNVIIAGDPGNPKTAPNLMSSFSSQEVHSVAASSDALGPENPPAFRLSKEKLNVVQSRDTHENIRQFLNLQRLSRLQPVDDPVSPPEEVSADSFKSSPTLVENLRTLPKLTIPIDQEQPSIFSAQRTITPSVLHQRPIHQEQEMYPYDQMASPGNFYRISDDYRADDIYRQDTPFSEMDVPVTAIPAGPIARDISQSVPPSMRFRDERVAHDPIIRPSSTKNDSQRRNNHPFINTQGLQSMGRVEEGKVAVIEGPEDLHGTALGPRTANDLAHSGWMKKRKNTRLLRHEWEEHHFTLKGTQLAMFENEWASRRDSRALECIDVDDYAVACSSLASNSKLSAAFKKNVLKRKENAADEAAFAFSLVPASKDKDSAAERKAFFLNTGKSHHFAVKSREERIDWMRELMLAKALKRGRQGGDSMEINGNMI